MSEAEDKADTVDGTKVLSRVSGLSEDAVREIWEGVKANHAKLQGCYLPHDLVEVVEKDRRLPRDYRCTKCGGTVPASNARWYIQGLRDGERHAVEKM